MQRNILIAIVALSVAFGVSAVAAADAPSIEIDQEPGTPATVTVTDANSEPVTNTTVTVELADDEQPAYNGTGVYTTDENGTVELPTPAESVGVVVTATVDNETVSAETTLEATPKLAIDVAQETGYPATVTVTADGEPVEDAAVTVESADENVTYDGAGEYHTDANGTVELPAPTETINVTVRAERDGASAATDTTLEAAPELTVSVAQDGPGLPVTVSVLADGEAAENVSVEVELVDAENTTHGGTGSYETDENGTVELPAPDETVDVAITASYNGAEETVVATLAGIDAIDDELPFGQQLQQFKATLDNDSHTGHAIASWVTDNNPGNAPDHAGPNGVSGHERTTGASDDAERKSDTGSSDAATANGDGNNGDGNSSGNNENGNSNGDGNNGN